MVVSLVYLPSYGSVRLGYTSIVSPGPIMTTEQMGLRAFTFSECKSNAV